MKHSYLIVFTCLLIAFSATTQAGKVYKWQDDDGSWHYSEKPPMEKEAEVLKMKVSEPTEQSKEETATTNDTKTKAGAPAAEQPLTKSPEILAAEKKQREENCARARKNLDSLTHRPRIRYMDKEKGEERYLTQEEHDEWSKKSKEEVKQYCQ